MFFLFVCISLSSGWVTVESNQNSYVQEFIFPISTLAEGSDWDGEYFRFEVSTSDNTTGGNGGRTQIKFWNDNSDQQWHDTRAFGVARLAPANVIPENKQISSLSLSENTDTCFNAYENITVAGDGTSVIFESGSSTTLIAGNSIRFLPGFHAQSGSWMDAHITTDSSFCNAANESMLAAQVDEKSMPVAETEVAVVIPGDKSIKVYPNPNNGQFFLEVSNFETRATVSIYNMLGSKVYESKMTNEINHKINLLGIKKGVYFVKVTDQKEQFTQKIIVN